MNHLNSLSEYEEFIYGLAQQFPTIVYSTLLVVRRGAGTALVRGEDRITIGISYYLEALRHNAQDTQTKQVLNYTRWMTLLTLIVTLATIVNVFIAFKLLPK